MVKVYFETDGYAELVAIFDTEEIYDVCYKSLRKLAFENGFAKITESIEEEELTNLKLS